MSAELRATVAALVEASRAEHSAYEKLGRLWPPGVSTELRKEHKAAQKKVEISVQAMKKHVGHLLAQAAELIAFQAVDDCTSDDEIVSKIMQALALFDGDRLKEAEMGR